MSYPAVERKVAGRRSRTLSRRILVDTCYAGRVILWTPFVLIVLFMMLASRRIFKEDRRG